MNLASSNVMVIYHLDSEEPRMIVKDAHNLNDPAWININEAPEEHVILHMEPHEYNPLSHEQLQKHHKKYIPIHKAWHKEHGHKLTCQRQARDAFREHLENLYK